MKDFSVDSGVHESAVTLQWKRQERQYFYSALTILINKLCYKLV